MDGAPFVLWRIGGEQGPARAWWRLGKGLGREANFSASVEMTGYLFGEGNFEGKRFDNDEGGIESGLATY
jgi:hypothetical protein